MIPLCRPLCGCGNGLREFGDGTRDGKGESSDGLVRIGDGTCGVRLGPVMELGWGGTPRSLGSVRIEFLESCEKTYGDVFV